MNWREAIAKTDAYLESKNVPDARVASELMAARLLRSSRGFLNSFYEKEVPEKFLEAMRRAMRRLVAGEPLQYVLGEWDFRSLTLKCDSRALIPRPETEELVYRIVETTKRGARILDIGTGSGAIAIALAKMIEGAEVVAIDISAEALKIAKLNAEKLGAKVEFAEADALGDLSHLGEFDIIVSNPPYIPQSDIVDMRKNVVDFEPHTALFVPDDDILKFYVATADNAQKMLCEGGSLWFEIYEKAGEELCEMLRNKGFMQTELIEDANLKPRMVWSRR
jgi:release factor glutamine methyltransferase